MNKTCLNCNNEFFAKRSDKFFCSKLCAYKSYNDKRKRKTGKSYMNANNKRLSRIPSNEVEVILGTVMGDGSLILSKTNNFHRLSLCHSYKQLDYIKLKKEILGSIFISESLSNSVNSFNNKQYHAHSIFHKDLTNIYGLFYRNKKKIVTRKLLNMLTPTSMLFWYLDDGTMMKASGNSIVLCTDSFSISENKAIKIWLWQKYRISVNIMPVKGSFGDSVYYRIRFNKENTIKFLNLISSSEYFQRAKEVMGYKFSPYFD